MTYTADFNQGSVTLHFVRYAFLSLYICVTSSSDGIVPSLPVTPSTRNNAQQVHFQFKKDVGDNHQDADAARGGGDGGYETVLGSQRDSYSTYGQNNNQPVILADEKDSVPWHRNVVRVLNPRGYSERLNITLLRSATTYLDVIWGLENGTGFSVVLRPKFSRIRCNHGNMTILHNIYGPATNFRIENLEHSTRYTVCVEMVTDASSTPTNNTKTDDIVHYKCVPMTTIPLVRPDSILGLLLTCGYVILMGGIGYVTWWMRMRKISTKRERRTQQEDEIEMSGRTSTVKFSDIEETSHLTSNAHGQTNSH